MWTWNESGGSLPSIRVFSTAWAFDPAPPATAWLKTWYCGLSLLNLSMSLVRPAASPPVVHQEKISTCWAPPPPPDGLAPVELLALHAANTTASAGSHAQRRHVSRVMPLPPYPQKGCLSPCGHGCPISRGTRTGGRYDAHDSVVQRNSNNRGLIAPSRAAFGAA